MKNSLWMVSLSGFCVRFPDFYPFHLRSIPAHILFCVFFVDSTSRVRNKKIHARMIIHIECVSFHFSLRLMFFFLFFQMADRQYVFSHRTYAFHSSRRIFLEILHEYTLMEREKKRGAIERRGIPILIPILILLYHALAPIIFNISKFIILVRRLKYVRRRRVWCPSGRRIHTPLLMRTRYFRRSHCKRVRPRCDNRHCL